MGDYDPSHLGRGTSTHEHATGRDRLMKVTEPGRSGTRGERDPMRIGRGVGVGTRPHSSWRAALRRGASALAALLALQACRQTAPAAAPPRPDILLVSIDSLRADHLGCYGYPLPTSPTLDRIATDGVRFDRAVSSTSWTLPAHAALFTSRDEEAHGLTRNGLRLSEAQVTMAEAFRDLGYQTAGLFAGPYLHPAFGLGQGFAQYQSCMAGVAEELPDAAVREEAAALESATQERETGTRTAERFATLVTQADERPAFLFVHLWDVHYDYSPPSPWDRFFDPDYAGTLDFSRLAVNPAIRAEMDPVDRRHLVALYDGEIRWTDTILARLLDLHARSRPDRELLLVVLSDHGEELFEHGGKGHQRTLFEEVVRIPLVIRWPGHLPTQRVIPDLVRIIDVFPTLLELVGAPPPEPLDGRSLVPLLLGEALDEQPALLELRVDPDRPLAALRTTTRKLVLSRWPELPAAYDLVADPGERHPLQGAPEREREAWRDFKRRLARAGDFLAKHPHRAPIGMQPGDEIARQLLALSYLTERDRR